MTAIIANQDRFDGNCHRVRDTNRLTLALNLHKPKRRIANVSRVGVCFKFCDVGIQCVFQMFWFNDNILKKLLHGTRNDVLAAGKFPTANTAADIIDGVKMIEIPVTLGPMNVCFACQIND